MAVTGAGLGFWLVMYVSTSDYLPCMRDKGYSWFADYHPADRFQWTEAGLLFVATLVLGAVVWRRTR